MRRDYVTLDVRNTDPDGNHLPTVVITVDEPTDQLGERLVTPDGETLDGDGIDVAFRLTSAVSDDDADGVFSLSNRVTGEFLLEVNTPASTVLDLVAKARKDDPDGTDGIYRVELRQDGEAAAEYEKQTLLVYDDEGNLLRQHSLIPSGVEL